MSKSKGKDENEKLKEVSNDIIHSPHIVSNVSAPSTPTLRHRSISGPPFLHRLRILIVDDNPINLQILNRLLLGKHFSHLMLKTELVRSGFLALQYLETQPFDMVLLDIHMPGLSGLDTFRRARCPTSKILEWNRGIPIVAVTADDDIHTRSSVQEIGMDGFVAKPVNIAELRSCIEKEGFSFVMRRGTTHCTQL